MSTLSSDKATTKEDDMAAVLAANATSDAADEVIARGNYTREDLARMREAQRVAIATGDAYIARWR